MIAWGERQSQRINRGRVGKRTNRVNKKMSEVTKMVSLTMNVNKANESQNPSEPHNLRVEKVLIRQKEQRKQ